MVQESSGVQGGAPHGSGQSRMPRMGVKETHQPSGPGHRLGRAGATDQVPALWKLLSQPGAQRLSKDVSHQVGWRLRSAGRGPDCEGGHLSQMARCPRGKGCGQKPD